VPDRPLIAFASVAINLIAYSDDAASLSPYPMVGGNLGAVTTSLCFYILFSASLGYLY
jgi:hypothetical protein